MIYAASFDIGKKNFAFYIEKFDEEILVNYPKNVNQKYNNDGTPTKEFGDVIYDVCNNGETVLFKNLDLTYSTDKKAYLDTDVLHNMTDVLDEHEKYWDLCSFFIIEKQMSFKKAYNTAALKLAQHCWSYFSFRYGRFKDIIEFPAYHKTQVLGAMKDECVTKSGKIRYKAIDKPARKKWSVTMALKILKDRGEVNVISELTSKRKKDDLADVLCQLQAFKILNFKL